MRAPGPQYASTTAGRRTRRARQHVPAVARAPAGAIGSRVPRTRAAAHGHRRRQAGSPGARQHRSPAPASHAKRRAPVAARRIPRDATDVRAMLAMCWRHARLREPRWPGSSRAARPTSPGSSRRCARSSPRCAPAATRRCSATTSASAAARPRLVVQATTPGRRPFARADGPPRPARRWSWRPRASAPSTSTSATGASGTRRTASPSACASCRSRAPASTRPAARRAIRPASSCPPSRRSVAGVREMLLATPLAGDDERRPDLRRGAPLGRDGHRRRRRRAGHRRAGVRDRERAARRQDRGPGQPLRRVRQAPRLRRGGHRRHRRAERDPRRRGRRGRPARRRGRPPLPGRARRGRVSAARVRLRPHGRAPCARELESQLGDAAEGERSRAPRSRTARPSSSGRASGWPRSPIGLAAEHLALHVGDPEAMLADIHRAGAAFLGPPTPEAMGDYLAGPSHVLPTGGAVRFGSPLGVYDFVTRTSIIRYSPRGACPARKVPYARSLGSRGSRLTPARSRRAYPGGSRHVPADGRGLNGAFRVACSFNCTDENLQGCAFVVRSLLGASPGLRWLCCWMLAILRSGARRSARRSTASRRGAAQAFFVGPDLSNPADDPEFYMGHASSTSPTASARTSSSCRRSDRLVPHQVGDPGDGAHRAPDLRAHPEHERRQRMGAQSTDNGQVVAEFNIRATSTSCATTTPRPASSSTSSSRTRPTAPGTSASTSASTGRRTSSPTPTASTHCAVAAGFDGIKYDPLAYYIEDPSDPNAPVFSESDGYFDVTTKVFATPQTIDTPYGTSARVRPQRIRGTATRRSSAARRRSRSVWPSRRSSTTTSSRRTGTATR